MPQMAAEFVRLQSEAAELRQYKAQLADKVKENQELVDRKTSAVEEVQQYNRLKEEKVILCIRIIVKVLIQNCPGCIDGFQRKTQRATHTH